jgi:rhodanese-related sulfurtransferase
VHALNYNVRPPVKFVQENLLLIAVAFVSGAMLLWPYVRRAGGGPAVSAAQATQLMNREDALVLDVRDPGEFGSGHIIGAKNMPLSRIDSAGSEIAAKRRDKPVIVYCDDGNRAVKAAAALRTQGFGKVVSLSGGLGAWRQAGLPVEK